MLNKTFKYDDNVYYLHSNDSKNEEEHNNEKSNVWQCLERFDKSPEQSSNSFSFAEKLYKTHYTKQPEEVDGNGNAFPRSLKLIVLFHITATFQIIANFHWISFMLFVMLPLFPFFYSRSYYTHLLRITSFCKWEKWRQLINMDINICAVSVTISFINRRLHIIIFAPTNHAIRLQMYFDFYTNEHVKWYIFGRNKYV